MKEAYIRLAQRTAPRMTPVARTLLIQQHFVTLLADFSQESEPYERTGAIERLAQMVRQHSFSQP